jgi:hypothetical protein
VVLDIANPCSVRDITTDFSSKRDAAIDQWIANFEKRRETAVALYCEFLEEWARRAEKAEPRPRKSLTTLKQAAICITYGDLVKASEF